MIDALKFLLGVFCFWGSSDRVGYEGLLGSLKLVEAASGSNAHFLLQIVCNSSLRPQWTHRYATYQGGQRGITDVALIK